MSINGWQSRTIGELLASSFPGDWGEEGNPEQGIPVLRSTNFEDDGSIDYSDMAFRSLAKGRLEKRRVGMGAILIEKAGGTSTRPAGRVVFCDREFNGTASNFVEIIHVKESYSPKFVFYRLYFNFHTGLVNKYQQQTTGIINFKFREYCSEVVELPNTKCEQSKIAEVLSTVERAIEQTEMLIAKQQRIKTGLMQDLLSHGIDDHGNVRSEQTHEFKDSPLGRIPVEWDVAPISKYGSRNWPSIRTGPFGSDLNTKHWVEYGVPVLTIGSLGEGEVLHSELLFVSDRTAEKLKGFRVVPGDIVFSRVADIGRSLVTQPDQDGWVISSNLMRISLDQSKARPAFLYRNIAFSSAVRAQLRTTSNYGGRDLVNGPILRALVFSWPGVGEQDRINHHLDSIEASIRRSIESLYKIQLLKIGLMQDLLTGRRRVTTLLPQPGVATA